MNKIYLFLLKPQKHYIISDSLTPSISSKFKYLPSNTYPILNDIEQRAKPDRQVYPPIRIKHVYFLFLATSPYKMTPYIYKLSVLFIIIIFPPYPNTKQAHTPLIIYPNTYIYKYIDIDNTDTDTELIKQVN